MDTLAPIDSAWLRMEQPTNLMTISALVLLDGPVPEDRIEELVRGPLLEHARFRRRVVEPGRLRRPRWVDAPIDLAAHLETFTLPAPGGDDELRALVGDRMSEPLDRSRPLWHLTIVRGYAPGGALLVRVHHALADGTALVRLLLSLTEGPDELGELRRRIAAHGRRRVGRALGLARALPEAVLLPRDPPTILQNELGLDKRAAWSWTYPLADVRDAARRLGVTINDVLAAAVTGGLHVLLGAGKDVKAIVPFDLRTESRLEDLGNQFGLVFLALPVGEKDRHARVLRAHAEMERVKRSSEAVLLLRALAAVGVTSARLEEAIVRFFGAKASLVFTNVVGPRHRRAIAGVPIRSLIVWNPLSAHLGLAVSVLSYAGEVRIGVASDANVVADPAVLVALIERELLAIQAM